MRPWLLLATACTGGQTEDVGVVAPFTPDTSTPLVVDVFEGERPEYTPPATRAPGIAIDSTCDHASWFFPELGVPVHVLGMARTHDGAPATVHHALDEPAIYVVTSRGRMDWTLTEEIPGTLVRVYTTGGSEASAPAGVPVERLGNASTLSWDSIDGRDVERLLTGRGLSVRSFHGCTQGLEWVVRPSDTPNPLVEPVDCSVAGTPFPPPDVSPIAEACPSQAAESAVCVDTTGLVLGVDSGTTCDLGLASGLLGAGLAWSGSQLVGCDGAGRLTTLDLRTGERVSAHAYCSRVATWRGGAAMSGVEGFVWYPTMRDAQCRRNAEGLGIRTSDRNFSIVGELAVTAWHSTNHVTAHDATTGARLDDIHLEGHDGWINTLSGLGDHTLFLSSRSPDMLTLASYDLRTGARLRTYDVDPTAMACVATGD